MGERPIDLGPFRLEETIGTGGMGAVWAGTHRNQRVPVAVKVVSERRARDERFHEAFAREVRAVASLDHPGIVLVFDQGVIDERAEEASDGALARGSPYLVMERLWHGSLRERLPASWTGLRRILVELLDALAHAHARGLVHRDIKPSNVMLANADEGPSIALTDFGIAHALDDVSSTAGASVTGTPHYMAPEQVRGELRDLGPWTDLYAVGCLAYRLASGRPPFFERGLEMAQVLLRQLEAPMPPLQSRLPVPTGFSRWLERLLAKDPLDRAQRAADAIDALRELGDVDGESLTMPMDPGEDTATLSDAPPTVFTVPATGTLRPPPTTSTTAKGRVARSRTRLPPTWTQRAAPRRSVALVGAGLGLYGLRPIPMVDRADERDRLWGALTDVHEQRRARVVVLRGPAGIGKSRLAEWLARRGHEVGAIEVLTATHGPFGGASDGIGPMLARALQTRGLSRARALARTVLQVRARGGSLDDAIGTVELTHPDHVEDRSSPRLRLGSPRERFMAATRWVELVAEERPVLLWIDDVQWGSDSLGWAEHLAGLERDVPVLVLLTVRDEALDPRVSRRLAELKSTSIEVGPLADADHAALVAQLLGLRGDVAEQVRVRTAGNPLFAVQLVGDWVARGILEVAGDGFRLSEGTDAMIPDDIHGMWLRRVEHVASDAWPALELAAVLGRCIDDGELAAALEASPFDAPSDLLDRLVLRGLAVEEESGWSFAHGMLVESLIRHAEDEGRFARHHLACAEALGGAARGISERRAGHLVAAGELEAALAPLSEAADERLKASDHGAAIDLLLRREALIETLDLPTSDPRRARGWVERAKVLNRQGHPKEAAPLVDDAEREAEREGFGDVLADVHWLRAKNEQMAGNVRPAIELFEKARDRYERAGNIAGLARCEHGAAEMLKQAGAQDDAADRYEAALRHYETVVDEFGRASCLLGYSDVLLQRDRARAMKILDEAREIHEGYGFRLGLAIVHLHKGIALRYDDDLDAAEVCFLACAEILDAIESTDAVVPRNHLGILSLHRGDFAKALAQFEANYAELAPTGREGYLGFLHVQLLPCYAHTQDWPRFDAHCASAEAALERSGLVDIDLEYLLTLASEIASAADEPDRAARVERLAAAQRKALSTGGLL